MLNKRSLLIVFFVFLFLCMIPSAFSTILTLNQADSEILDDTWIESDDADSDRGTDSSLFLVTDGTDYHEVALKFNISALPQPPITIYSANLSLYLAIRRIEVGESYSGDAHHIFTYPTYTPNASAEWNEGNNNHNSDCVAPEMCWGTKPTTGEYNSTAESSVTFDGNSAQSQFYDWDVKDMVRTAYAQDDQNISIWIKANYISGSINLNNDNIEFASKEYFDNTKYPKLTIDYDGPPALSNAWNSSPSYKQQNTTFNISISDARDNIQSVTLYWNESGSWAAGHTETGVGVQDYNFSVSLNLTTKGVGMTFGWLVQACDTNGNCANSSTYMVTAINTAPAHTAPVLNSSLAKNNTHENLTCYNQNTNDADGDTVTNIYKWYKNSAIQNNFENSTYINSTDTSMGDVWICQVTPTDVYLSGTALNSSPLTIKNHVPEFRFNSSVPSSPVEGDQVYVSAEVFDADADLVDVYFTVTAPNGTNILYNQSAASHAGDFWNSSSFTTEEIGTWLWNITAYDGSVTSEIEGNFTIYSWHYIMGNVTGMLTLEDSVGGLINWEVANTSGSNIYVSDSDSSINFNSLKALSRDTGGSYAGNDFDDADSLLGMESFVDSVNKTYTTGGNPKATSSFNIFGSAINNVPVVDSTDSNNGNFITGILWDSNDDAGSDGEYDAADREDLVFITKVNQNKQGKYGVYDYEIRVPANLRKYDSNNVQSVSIYAEIK